MIKKIGIRIMYVLPPKLVLDLIPSLFYNINNVYVKVSLTVSTYKSRAKWKML